MDKQTITINLPQLAEDLTNMELHRIYCDTLREGETLLSYNTIEIRKLHASLYDKYYNLIQSWRVRNENV